MKHSARPKTTAETKTLLAVTLACYLAAFACALTLSYSLAGLAAPVLLRHTAAVTAPYGL